jgi:hypothetical protein
MRDGWMEATIGDIADVIAGGTPSTREPSYWGGGIPWIVPSEITRQEGKRITSTDRTITEAGLRAIRGPLLPVDTVLLTSRATVGAVALAGIPMAINQGFAALVAGPRVLPRFLMYWCQANRATFEALAGGSTFPEVSRPKVRSVPILLPPFTVQRRITDLIGAIDEVAEVADRESTAAWGALSAFLVSSIPAPSNSGSPINSLLALDIGGVWGSEAGVDECDVVVYRSTEFSSDGWADPSTAALRSVSASQMKSRALRGGDVLLEKSGGTPTRPVGRVVRCQEPSAPAVMSNFVQVLRPDPVAAEPSFLFWTLWSWHRRGISAEYQTATTNIRNLRTRDYLGLRVDLPQRDAQRAASAAADGLQDVAIKATSTRDAVQRLRSSVLSDLLSGSHFIPTSYDRFLDPAA